MLLTRCQLFFLVALVVNIGIFLYLVKIQNDLQKKGLPELKDKNQAKETKNKELTSFEEYFTIVIQEFEDFENHVSSTVREIRELLPEVKIVIVSDKLIYPPLNLKNIDNVETLVLYADPNRDLVWNNPSTFIYSKYIMILPDAVQPVSRKELEELVDFFSNQPQVNSLAVPISQENLQCHEMNISLKQWTVMYGNRFSLKNCDAVSGNHVMMVKTDQFLQLPYAFLRPTNIGFYIQAKLRGWKVNIYDRTVFKIRKALFSDPHNSWKHKRRQKKREKNLYSELKIKKIVDSNGQVRWYGCSKETSRCFGTVVNDMPEFIYSGKWTPPCCLEAVRKTAQYVFKVLDRCQVRYWLEGGSLLGAARNGDVIPWDYDVDIGVYKDDVDKCQELKDCKPQGFVDQYGFKWEKAREGDFYRVQYSETNHMHVDIFPFYSKNGTMTKDTWISTHRQDTEFPEHYLKPLTKIKFAGTNASAPNNIKNFLEYKFGAGVIENPRYPNAEKVKTIDE